MKLHCYCDGGFKKNGGYFSIAIFEVNGDSTKQHLKTELMIPVIVNSGNQAEYRALIYLLETLIKSFEFYDIIIYTDSKLIWGQMSKRYGVYSNNIKTLYDYANMMLTYLEMKNNTVKFEWTSRKTMVDLFGH